MKKNLLSILILILLIVNIALTAVMMISITDTNKKTAELVTSIATVMNLELYSPNGEAAGDVALADTDIYDMEGTLMIPLANDAGEEGGSKKQNYIIFSLSLLQNKNHADYKTLGGAEKIKASESLIKDTVNSVVGSYTLDQCRNDFDKVRNQILTEIQKLFGSNFIYKVAISGITYG